MRAVGDALDIQLSIALAADRGAAAEVHQRVAPFIPGLQGEIIGFGEPALAAEHKGFEGLHPRWVERARRFDGRFARRLQQGLGFCRLADVHQFERKPRPQIGAVSVRRRKDLGAEIDRVAQQRFGIVESRRRIAERRVGLRGPHFGNRQILLGFDVDALRGAGRCEHHGGEGEGTKCHPVRIDPR